VGSRCHGIIGGPLLRRLLVVNPAAWLALFLFTLLLLVALRIAVRVPDRIQSDNGPARALTLRTAAGAVLIFLAFVTLARVYLVSDTPHRPGLWALGSLACAVAAWLLLRRQAPGR
jgi:uncharacterized BrkB/YihY/UPF0761 family membrane protein